MDYGHFSDDGRDFLITRPDTPKPWFNCLTNGNYSAIVSQTGGGYSFIGGPGYDRITRSAPDLGSSDVPGRHIFVRDNGTGEYFSIGWQPVKRQPEMFECRHSQGITTITSRNLGIEGSINFFVPIYDNLEIWRVSLANRRSEPVDLSVFTYVEWVLGNYADDLEKREFISLFNDVNFQDNYIVATKNLWRRPDTGSVSMRELKVAGGPKFLPETLNSNQPWGKHAFIALNVPVVGFDCDRQAFLGRYGDLSRPQVVEHGECSNSGGDGRDAVGVLQTRFIIPPGEQENFDVFLGITLNRDDPSGIVARYSELGEVDGRLQAVRSYWDLYTAKVTVNTPDPEIDRTVNIWDKYQTWVSVRTQGLASPDAGGASIIGFRESAFDLLGVLPMDPDYAKLEVVRLMQHQYRDGSTVDHWEPRSNVGARSGYQDNAIWLVFALISYLKETGDFSFLDDRIKYYYSQSPASVYEHLVKAIEFCLSQVSARRLSLLGPGDWNDALDQAGSEGKGESVLTSQILYRVLTDAIALARLEKDRVTVKSWSARAVELKAKLNELTWDGEWFIRATGDQGQSIGSTLNPGGRLHLDTQSWSVISGAASGERADQAMESARRHLDTPYGPALILDPYRKPDRQIGTITRFPTGTKQNGGIYTVAAAWAVMAECILGHGARAYDIYRKSLHSTSASEIERYKAAPYVHAEHVLGTGSDRFGEGMFTWTAGVAAWTWRALIDWICGVRPDFNGLRIDPCVPPDWREFSIIRPYRDAVYTIAIRNPDGVEKGVRLLTVDGKKVDPKTPVRAFRDRKVHAVEAEMGE